MNGEAMNGASILMNLTAATPVTSAAAAVLTTAVPETVGAQALPVPVGFGEALAAAQAGVVQRTAVNVPPVSLKLVSSLLLGIDGTDSTVCPGAVEACESALVEKVDADVDAEIDAEIDKAEEVSASGAVAILVQLLLGSTPPSANEAPSAVDVPAQIVQTQVENAPAGSR